MLSWAHGYISNITQLHRVSELNSTIILFEWTEQGLKWVCHETLNKKIAHLILKAADKERTTFFSVLLHNTEIDRMDSKYGLKIMNDHHLSYWIQYYNSE